jgi:ABC-type multidrug transport system ATPase subunit
MHAVAADRVWKYFGDYPALRGVDLEVAKGSCLALLGRNGAGKTTMLRILANLSRPTKGEVRIDGAIGYRLLR